MSAESRKPSPGPWYAVAHPDESCSAISISLNRNDFAGGIATVYLNAIPNAELIIQAPALAAELAKLREALIAADGILLEWEKKYGEWSNANPQMERLMDRRLPPAYHLRVREMIEETLSKAKGRPG